MQKNNNNKKKKLENNLKQSHCKYNLNTFFGRENLSSAMLKLSQMLLWHISIDI